VNSCKERNRVNCAPFHSFCGLRGRAGLAMQERLMSVFLVCEYK
jgi:hypothetical protein